MSSTPPSGPFRIQRVAANEETTVLTPISDGTAAIDRIPVSRQRLGIAVTSVLAVLLIIAIIFIVNLRNVSHEWSDQVDAIKAQNYDLGTRLGDEQSQVVDLQSQLDEVSGQLKTAQQKILTLSDEKAQQGDNVEFYARQIDELTTELSTSAGVANALERCIEGKTQLIGILEDSANYDETQIADFKASLKIKCDNAIAANVELQRVLAK